MTKVQVIKAFFEKDATRKVETREYMEFFKACSPAEREEFAQSAAKQLGVELSE